MTTNQRLIEIMTKYHFPAKTIARFLSVSPAAIACWKAPPDSKHFRAMPAGRLDHLEMIIKNLP